MKIVKAMKKIARLKGEIKEIKNRITCSLNTIVGNEFEEDLETLSHQQDEKIEEIVKLKIGVMTANIKYNMFAKIVMLGELKSQMDFIKELEPKTGVQENRYNESKTEYKTQMTKADKNVLIDRCQKLINELTDALDDFNAKTDIEDVVVQ